MPWAIASRDPQVPCVDEVSPPPVASRTWGLSAERLVGAPWVQGNYRYIPMTAVDPLKQMLEETHGIG